MTKHVTPAALFAYADRYARKRERAGQGTVYPTVRQAARRFGCRQDVIESAANEGSIDGYLGLAYYNVNYKVPLGDNYVEAYK